MALNGLWEKVEKISLPVIWLSLLLLFTSSFLPYATGLVSNNFHSKVMQGFYGLVVILTTVVNWFLHKVLDKPNADNKELLAATKRYRKSLIPDISIKVVGFAIAMAVYPPIMSYSVLIAAAYIIGIRRHFVKEKSSAEESIND